MRRMIPEKAQKYIKELSKAHPDPTASWGGSGSDYTAGNGIDITDGTISIDYGTGLTVSDETLIIDTSTVALKSDTIGIFETSNITALTNDQLNAMKTGDVVRKITGDMKHTYTVTYKEEEKGICISYFAAGYTETVSYDYVDGNWVYNSTDIIPIPTNSDYVDLTTNQTVDGNKTFEKIVLSKNGFGVEVTGLGAIGVIDKDANNNLEIRGNTKLRYGGEVYGLPSKTDGTYTLATTVDIPTVTSSITQYSTDAVTSGAVYDAIGDIESLLAAI